MLKYCIIANYDNINKSYTPSTKWYSCGKNHNFKWKVLFEESINMDAFLYWFTLGWNDNNEHAALKIDFEFTEQDFRMEQG